ncbi:glycine hydroxymethyltransferase [Crossiella equi]|uniref:Glycine hydroxymethyltransferase n=1 Tax=Crossiella equi TaxID=130796 RepID=A0ABS5ALN8_9PSEU|nr:beta-eliminating lyase-related protein [Crossiella equi]MBP2477480.1 glycine hydroxymethyltransferase [Crossiella equi]
MSIPPEHVAYVDALASELDTTSPREIAARVAGLVAEHDQWRRGRCLNLLASDNTMTPGARRLLDCDLAIRVSEGLPGAKIYPKGKGNTYIDQIEGILISLAKKLFRADYVEHRATSNSMANAMAMSVLTKPGDTIIVQTPEGGGNMSYQPEGSPGLLGLRVLPMPADDFFNIDVPALAAMVRQERPSLLVIGGGKVLFPYPVTEIASLAVEVGARVLYDAAHVGGLIAAGRFQDPLREGADVLTTGTHKLQGGPVGGLLLTNDREIAGKVYEQTYPTYLQTRDGNKYAAAAYALAESLEFMGSYATQSVTNARALAIAATAEGFGAVGADRGFTETHHVLLDASRWGAWEVEHGCERANIFLHATRLPGDTLADLRGLRVGVQEVTRLGMREPEMAEIAVLLRRAAENDPTVTEDVEKLLSRFPEVAYAF